MPTWIEGIPRDNGATDLEDSARLAGIMVAAKLRPYPAPSCYLNSKRELARWSGSTLPFTRDQLLCLAYFNSWNRDHNPFEVLPSLQMDIACKKAATKYTAPNGKDLLNPAHRSHLRACTGGSWSLLGKAFLLAEIYWHAMHERGLSEPNQLICMLLTAGPWYVRLWKRVNSNWRESINYYWCGWRNEPELAKQLIQRLEQL